MSLKKKNISNQKLVQISMINNRIYKIPNNLFVLYLVQIPDFVKISFLTIVLFMNFL